MRPQGSPPLPCPAPGRGPVLISRSLSHKPFLGSVVLAALTGELLLNPPPLSQLSSNVPSSQPPPPSLRRCPGDLHPCTFCSGVEMGGHCLDPLRPGVPGGGSEVPDARGCWLPSVTTSLRPNPQGSAPVINK